MDIDEEWEIDMLCLYIFSCFTWEITFFFPPTYSKDYYQTPVIGPEPLVVLVKTCPSCRTLPPLVSSSATSGLDSEL